MKRASIYSLVPLLVIPCLDCRATGGLQVAFGDHGIQQLTYNGAVLEDLAQNPSDAFHIWHMKCTDAQGNVLSNGQYGWGESSSGHNWNSATHTWTYAFTWGAISLQFVQSGDTLDMKVTETNLANSGITFDGATIYPFVLHFPQLPSGFGDHSYEHLTFNTTGPSVTTADFEAGQVVAAVPDPAKPLYSGFEPASGADFAYFPIISGTSIDSMASFMPRNDRPVLPGQTDSFTVSLRFAPSGTPAAAIVADVYKNWAKTWPPQVNWTDRRIIGTVYLASSAQGNQNQPAGFPNNPRRYFNDANAGDLDIRTPAGLALFQARILKQAHANIKNLQRLNAQGAITWDIEGEQYPQQTSYVCAPDQIAQVAPEMESVIGSPSSPYTGMKLDDAYFKVMRDAGFRAGVCIRPQHFTLNPDGTAEQAYLPDSQIAAELIRKAKYAHDRWGVTLFYVDSSVDQNGGVLDPGVFQQTASALPDSLFIPEESTPKYFAYTAPFNSFIFHTDLGTPADIYDYYPKAFSVNLINDVDPGKLSQYRQKLTDSVRRGDILMVHADYWQANNPTVFHMYKDAGVTAGSNPTSVPSTAKVVIVSPSAGQQLSGTVSVSAQINAALDSAGSYLAVDDLEIGAVRVTSPPYSYLLNTTALSNGQHTFEVWAHDIDNGTLTSAPVNVTISNAVVQSTEQAQAQIDGQNLYSRETIRK
ncbi:MAG: Ig-like domain-containing protein [Acidobacteriota bacterium]|nr:Ig-like domain-containing protein [Acidobacteriota bacterium]